LPDSGHLQEEQAEFANRHGFSKHSPALPLYTEHDANECLKRFRTISFGEVFEPVSGMRLQYSRAGHLPGAASIRDPAIILAASGVATGGRVVHHLKMFVTKPRNTVLFSGFQAGGTRGASLVAGARELRMHGETFPVLAEVCQLQAASGHADADEAIAWLRQLPKAPRHIFITHGEPSGSDALRQRLQSELGWAASVPEYRDAVQL
jgi:Cft2 family RNA processing exonuclease